MQVPGSGRGSVYAFRRARPKADASSTDSDQSDRGIMRMWSLSPKVLDAKGIVACWRESLLAQAVLAGQTKGYTHHPQLDRFRSCKDPLVAVAGYLEPLADEADRRGYHFDRGKILRTADEGLRIDVNDQQLAYEWRLLLRKLENRDSARYELIRGLQEEAHPLFNVVPGPIASWEKALPDV